MVQYFLGWPFNRWMNYIFCSTLKRDTLYKLLYVTANKIGSQQSDNIDLQAQSFSQWN